MNAYLSKNITTATTTTPCGTQGILHTVVVNKTAAGTIGIYDGPAATGTLIATLKASIVEGTYTFDAVFNNSLVIVTGAASDVTVTYAVAGS